MPVVSRVYLIGAGVIAGFHAKAIRKLPNAADVALCVADPNPEAIAKFTAKFPHARPFSDAAAMLAEPAQPGDLVVVATPPWLHAQQSIDALRHGRHVLCEKPFALNRREAEQMLAAARENNLYIGCCSARFIGQPPSITAREKIAAGELGELYHVNWVYRLQRNRSGLEYQPQSPWMLDRSRNGGGQMMSWGPYDFTILNDLLRPARIEVVSAWTTQVRTQIDPTNVTNDVETHAGAQLRYHLPDNQVVHVNYERASCTHGPERSFAELEGTRGAIAWDWVKSGAMDFSYDVQGKVHVERIERGEEPLGLHDKPLVYLAQRIAGDPTSLAVVNEQAVFNFRCIDAIYEVAATGQPVVVE